ncbi:MAG TPA: response regulator [Candidatus Acidoferrum sp.]|nr:response regulator [Candidatus Acidoferrum sp.]
MTAPDINSSPRILIVDDNPSIHRDFDLVLLESSENAELEADERRLYGRAAKPALLKPPYTVDHALSGLEGVEKVAQALAAERPYQLAFVDIRMPGIDGVETIQRIWEKDPRVQVVICTAFADYSWEDLVRRWGQTDKLLVLKKPFDSIEVILLASTLTEKWSLARQATLKQEEMERLVARRTQRLLELQPREAPAEAAVVQGTDGTADSRELPLMLLVASDPAVSAQVTQGLGNLYQIMKAQDGEEGWRQAQELVPDLVIAELALPRLDGAALCRAVKGTEMTSHIPVILVAPQGREGSQARALEARADHCLPQPLSLTVLKARVDDLLRSGSKAKDEAGTDASLPASRLAVTQADAQFLKRAMAAVDRHLSDFEFDVEVLAKRMAVSRRQLFRKLKAVPGTTPNALIRSMRLKRAAHLLQESEMTVTEITYAVGFSDLKHFRTVFKEQFGVLPGDYPRKGADGVSGQPTEHGNP